MLNCTIKCDFSSMNEDKMSQHVCQHDLETAEIETVRFKSAEKATERQTFEIDKSRNFSDSFE